MARRAGTSGNDSLGGGAGSDRLTGGAGNDRILGDTENSSLSGGNDRIEGGAGADYIDAGKGNDTVRGGEGADTLIGGAGRDLLSYHGGNSPEGVSIKLAAATASGGNAQGDSIARFEHVVGSDHNDHLFGTGGADTLDGGVGTDGLSYWQSNAGVYVNIATNSVSGRHGQGDVISNFENIGGSRYDDTLIGNAGDNRIHGGKGADSLDGGGGQGDMLSNRPAVRRCSR